MKFTTLQHIHSVLESEVSRLKVQNDSQYRELQEFEKVWSISMWARNDYNKLPDEMPGNKKQEYISILTDYRQTSDSLFSAENALDDFNNTDWR